MAEDIGCEDLAKRRLIFFAVIAFIVGNSGACLSCGGLAGDAQLVRGIGERGKEISQRLLDSSWPVNSCKSTISRIADDGIKAREIS